MKILMTGYGPFGDVKDNPSWLAVHSLSQSWHSEEHELVTAQVPVSYNYVQTHIPPLLKQYQPDLVIHVGVGHSGKICLETCAHSNGYVRLDIDGHSGPCGGDCVCLKTCLDVDRVVEECASCRPDEFGNIQKSADAGRYLCEFIFYTSLHEVQQERRHTNVLFVHVPDLTAEITLEKVTGALGRILHCCLEQTATCQGES